MDTSESILRAILSTVARGSFSTTDIRRLISPLTNAPKQIVAYNLCDGKTSQADIGKRAKLDKGSLSRSIARWIEMGIVFRIGPEDLPLHVFPFVERKGE